MRIIRLDGTVIEGEPNEIAQYEAITRLEFDSVIKPITGSHSKILPDRPIHENWRFVSAELAFRALTRIRLSEVQRKLLKFLYDAHPDWVSASKLQQHVGYSPSQFAGLMGAFGRRVCFTPGYVVDSMFFDQDWDEAKFCNIYRLPDTVREALELAKLV